MGHSEAFLVRDWLLANGVRTFIRTDYDSGENEVGVWVLETEAQKAEQLFYCTEDPRIRAVRRIPWYHQNRDMYEPPPRLKELLIK